MCQQACSRQHFSMVSARTHPVLSEMSSYICAWIFKDVEQSELEGAWRSAV